MRNFSTLFRLLMVFILCGITVTQAVAAGDNARDDKQGEAEDKRVTVRGVVVTSDDPPMVLPGATVVVKGTTRGVATDSSGFFSIEAERGEILRFQFIGYEPKEFRVTRAEANLSIALEEVPNVIDQVIVTGMSSQQKKQVAAAVGTIPTEMFENKPITRLSQALQGGTTGITVTQSSGLPGSDGASIKIRGLATLQGSNPLVLVDGFEFSLDKVDPATVESITILKDAAAASVYGAKAGNGVILVTTKRGTAGKVSVSYNGYYGVQSPMYMPDFVDAATYMEYINTAERNNGSQTDVYSPEEIQITREGTDPLHYPNTDWVDWTMKKTTPIQEHRLQVSGGNTTARFALSAQYLKQDGMYKYMENGFTRMSVRANTTVNLSRNIYIYTDMYISKDEQKQPITNRQTILDYIYRTPPTVVAEFPRKEGQAADDDYIYYGLYNDIASPLINLREGTQRTATTDYVSINARPTWQITEQLTLKGQAGYRLSSGVTRDYRKGYPVIDYWTGTTTASQLEMVTTTSFPHRQTYWMVGLTLDYNAHLGKDDDHRLNVFGGWNQESIDETGSSNYVENVTGVSFFGKAYYSYKDKYLAEAGVRADGTSLFGPGKKWGVFPSIAVGWNVLNERFMEGAKNVIDVLKVRASYGVLGNADISPYKYQNIINDDGKELVNGNPDLTWEKVAIWNAGVDVSLWNGSIDLTFDAFRKRTTDLLISVPGTISSGFLSVYSNAGKAEVKGCEVSLGINHEFGKDVSVNFNAGYSYNKSKLLEITNGEIVSGDKIYKEGESVIEYYGYGADGLLSQEDLDSYYPIMGGYNVSSTAQKPGDVKYLDMNGDGNITSDDMRPIGPTEPTDVYFANLSVRVKNVDISVQANGIGYVPVFYTNLMANPLNGDQGGVPQKWHLDYWTPERPNARLPRPLPDTGNNSLLSTFWKENGAFLRIKYIQLGYNIPWLAKKLRADNFRLYVNAQNPFTFTKVDLIDPETKGTQATHPMFKVYSVGLNIKF